MNFDELQKAWGQQTVAGKAVDVPRLRAELSAEIRQRSRSIRRLIRLGLFVLLVGWAVVLAAHFTGIRPLNRVTLTTFVVTAVLDIVGLIVAFQALNQMRREAIGMGETLADSLRTSLRAVERQMRNCRLLGWSLLAGFCFGTAMTLVHYFTGNLPFRGVIANSVLVVIFGVAIATTLDRYYRRQLIPRRDALRQALADVRE